MRLYYIDEGFVYNSFFSSVTWLTDLESKAVTDPPARPTIHINKTDLPPAIDGVLTDQCWQSVPPISGFVQFDPNYNALPSETTRVWLCYDQDNLYVAAYCYDSTPDKITAHLTRRDFSLNDDFFILVLDPYDDHRTAYWFGVNPYGIQSDLVGNGNNNDDSWDAIWRSAGRKTNDGWTIEMAVPFKALRFSSADEQIWGVFLYRNIRRRSEDDLHISIDRNKPLLEQTAALSGIKGVRRGRHLEFLPYLLSGAQGSQFAKSDRRRFDMGLDTKVGLTSNLTLDLTLNPDFGQIEADQEQINLTPYETFFREKRPFFLEGMTIFNTPAFNLFYSRRIVDPVTGIKLTGKDDKYGIGIIAAVDEVKGGPDNWLTVVRLKRDVGASSTIGFIFTDRQNRDYFGQAVGIDGDFNFRGIYSAIFQVAQTRDTAVSRNNNAFAFRLSRYPSEGINVSLNITDIQEAFHPVTGYVQRTEIREAQGWLGYQFRFENSFLRRINVGTSGFQRRNHEGHITRDGAIPEVNVNFGNNMWASVGGGKTRNRPQLRTADFSDLVWGPTSLPGDFWYVNYSANQSGLVNGGFNYFQGKTHIYFDYFRRAESGNERGFFSWLEFKPLSNLAVESNINHYSQYQNGYRTRLYNNWIFGTYFRYQIRRNLYSRVFLQSNTNSHEHFLNSVIGYNYRPGSYLYLTFNNRWLNNEGKFKPNGWIVLLKVNYLLNM